MSANRAEPPVTEPCYAQQLWFTGLTQVEVRRQLLPPPAAGEVRVRVECCAISAGTELLVYRGQIPQEMALDANLDALQHSAKYPLQYGYASVGLIEALGAGLDASLLGQRVFAFQPHASHFVAPLASLMPVPADISAEDAVFLPNMETAVNLVQDGNPNLGERVVVLGQGIVGLLLTQLLARFPLAQLCAVDALAARRKRALQLGAQRALAPDSDWHALQSALQTDVEALAFSGATALSAAADSTATLDSSTISGADLIYEVSGAPAALNTAIGLSGFASRIVIGSWYGSKSAPVVLGGAAHRNRVQLITSQVSSLAPALTGRWNKQRRFACVWNMLRQLRPSQLITHRAPLAQAASIYQQLHQAPTQPAADMLQVIFNQFD